MDRYDEKKSGDDSGERGGQIGDVLGLGGSAVPKSTDDPQASDDPESIRRRRERALSSDEESRTQTESDRQNP